jgi:hypothetical protein
LGHHRLKHDTEGKTGAGLEKKQEKTGRQNVPAMEDVNAGSGGMQTGRIQLSRLCGLIFVKPNGWKALGCRLK